MVAISGNLDKRRASNAKALAAFGVATSAGDSGTLYRTIREGKKVTLYTIGYEKRDGEDLIAALRDAGVEHLADVRDKPISRKPDFRASALRALCEDAGIEYGPWTDLGSTEAQREQLHASGDLEHFHKTFRAYAKRSLTEPLNKLAAVSKTRVVALMCYERAHEECHRSVVAELVADRIGAGITAIA